jgi:ketosteroid isomerase-like protein
MPRDAEVVRRWFDCFAAGSPGVELCDPKIRIDNLAEFPVTGPYHGHDGVRRWWGDLLDAIDGLQVHLRTLVEVDETQVVTSQRLVGRFRHTGIDIDAPWASVISVEDGKIVRAVGYGSRREAYEAAGFPGP